MAGSGYTEDALVERPAIALLEELSWKTANCYYEFEQPGGSPLGRETKGEVVLVSLLRSALERLNPELPPEGVEQAIEELTRDRSAMSLAAANREVYRLLKDGIKVTVTDPEGDGEKLETVRVIDWNHPENNDFFLASQFWITGEMYTRRADLIGFVNGLPLVFIELKASHRRLQNAYKHNLRDYKDTIPHLFWYNSIIILSNGSESVIGSLTSEWGHFTAWKKINSEGEEGIISLATMLRGTCEPRRLLDIIENFILFQETQGGIIKLVAKNHQHLGVNKALESLKEIQDKQGQLGVFWHTQGSGKSVSMIFFSQKVLRKMTGNWTFVILTDRKVLDNQIYGAFTSAGVVTEERAHATNSEHLRRLLREDHRYIFTLIHKFRTEQGERHPVLSERSNIVVFADEAHRTQYDTLAMNMRTALPNAAFIAFTGTPLIVGEEKTRQVFGDYVSIYNFKQSVDDHATVPLYYENRVPEVQLKNEDLNEDIERVLEEAELDEEQEKKLEREFSREYHIITRDDRLDTIASDIVDHFTSRGFQGKAMVVCIDKATALRMYDKVQKRWGEYLYRLQKELTNAPSLIPGEEVKELEDKVRYMENTDMAVVISQAQNEIADMREKGLDIRPHRHRMLTEDLDTKFKDPDDPFRIVFVCAMWMTGFDVPSCSTIYLDKPMRNHTLMQTIARANRIFRDKVNGLIVDYIGVFRNLQRALAIYGSGSGGGVKPGENPIRPKDELVEELKLAIGEVDDFCTKLGIDLGAIQKAEGFDVVRLMDEAVESILVNDETKKRYLSMAVNVRRLYKAILPDPQALELKPVCILIHRIAQKIHSLVPIPDISEVKAELEELLDDSIVSVGYQLDGKPGERYKAEKPIDLSKIDFDALREKFEKGRKRMELEKLRGAINSRLKKMIRLNRTRMNYVEKLQEMIEEYNSGSKNVEETFKQLMKFAKELSDEEQRTIAEGLPEEELTVFDLLIKPEMQLSEPENLKVKKVARELLETIKREKLVLDWRKRQQSRAAVKLSIEEILDNLPPCYTRELYQRKCEAVYQHIYESYYGLGRSVYVAVV